MATEIKPSGLDFGVVMAFIAPGFLALLALAYELPTAHAWVVAASEAQQSVGVFLIVALASLSLGLVVSGVRSLVVDSFLSCGWPKKRWWPKKLGWVKSLPVPKLNLDWSRVGAENLVVLITIRDNHYRYYQFYSNSFVALAFWALARVLSRQPALSWWLWFLIAGAASLLLLSARQALCRYVDGVHRLLPPR